MYKFILTTSILISLLTKGQTETKYHDDNYKLANKVLISALSHQPAQTDNNTSLIQIKDSAQAISIAEQALFKVYGQKHITDQKPYHLYNIKNHWVMFGTLHYTKGGTFYIVIDAADSKIIDMYHEK